MSAYLDIIFELEASQAQICVIAPAMQHD